MKSLFEYPAEIRLCFSCLFRIQSSNLFARSRKEAINFFNKKESEREKEKGERRRADKHLLHLPFTSIVAPAWSIGYRDGRKRYLRSSLLLFYCHERIITAARCAGRE
jgi:hypothetical protein